MVPISVNLVPKRYYYVVWKDFFIFYFSVDLWMLIGLYLNRVESNLNEGAQAQLTYLVV